jgi:hypothetical protein
MATLKRSEKVQSIIFPLYRGNGHFGHLGRYPNSQENVFWTFWTSDPGALTGQSIHEVFRQTNLPLVRDGLNLPHHILQRPRCGLLQRPDSPVPGRIAPCCPRGSGHPYGVHDILQLGQL